MSVFNLDTLLLLPFAAALAMAFMNDRGARTFGVVFTFVQTVLAGYLACGNVPLETLAVKRVWIPQMGLSWSLGLDGANLWLVVLTPLLTGLALLTVSEKTERIALYSAALMLLNAMLSGLFLAQNLGLFYIFFEGMLIPGVLLVAGWSVKNGKETAVRFLMFTLIGSLPMLLGVLVLAFAGWGADGSPNLDFTNLDGLPQTTQLFLFVPFALAFLVKMPVFPFHGWLPPLYRNAPASTVAVIAAMMSKAGAYGLLKVGLTVFPLAMVEYLNILGTLVVISLLYGAYAALGSDSLREVLAFSSLSHMAMIALGIVTLTEVGAAGSILQMAGHALATGGLFLAVALMEKRGMPDELRRFGGMAGLTPKFTVLVLFLVLASLGQPGLGSFPGELLILTGVYGGYPVIAVISCLGIILAAAYMLRWYQTIFTGELGTFRPPSDLRGRELAVLLVPVVLSLVMGLAPSIFLQPIQAWVAGVL